MAVFDHEKLEVYRLALDFVALSEELLETLPAGHADLCDQLRRARASTVLNIAEAAGEFSRKEKARFYRMARRSATESAGVLDLFATLALSDASALLRGKELLARIVSMLVALVRTVSGSGTGRGTGTGTGTGSRT